MGSTLGTALSVSTAQTDVAPSTFVVPLDGSDLSLRAAPVASWFAARFDADVVVVATSSMADADDALGAVSAIVATHPHSAVCMSTHSHGAVTAAALGTFSARVVRDVGVPVLLVGVHCVEPRFDDGPIIVSHDGSPAADAILGPARAWARALDAPIVLAHVHDPLDVRSQRDSAEAIEAALEFLGTGTCLEMVADSFAAGAIRNVAHELDASLIALSDHGRGGSPGAAMGSVASWVTRESSCPVLTVHPESE